MAESAIEVMKQDTKTSLAEVNQAPVVAYYFSAHWCPPCRKFTPVLIENYNKWNANGKQIEVVFCSFDRDEGQYKEYYNSMPWTTLGFNSKHAKDLGEKFECEGIPFLCIVSKDGKEELLSNNGYEDLLLKKEKAIDEWKKLY